MIKALILLSSFLILSVNSIAQSAYERYLNQGISLYKKSDFLSSFEMFDLANEMARTNKQKLESKEWEQKSKAGIKKQAKELMEASRLRKEALLMKTEAEKQRIIALEQKQVAIKQQALARLKEFEMSKILKAIYFYDNKYSLSNKNGLFGFIDKEGNTKIEFKYEQANSFDQTGFAKVKRDRKYFLIDTTGTEYLLALNLNKLNKNAEAIDLRGWELSRFPRKLLRHPQLQIILIGDNNIVTIPDKVDKVLPNCKIIF